MREDLTGSCSSWTQCLSRRRAMKFRSGIYIVPTHRWYIERTVWLIAGTLLLICTALAAFDQPAWEFPDLCACGCLDHRGADWLLRRRQRAEALWLYADARSRWGDTGNLGFDADGLLVPRAQDLPGGWISSSSPRRSHCFTARGGCSFRRSSGLRCGCSPRPGSASWRTPCTGPARSRVWRRSPAQGVGAPRHRARRLISDRRAAALSPGCARSAIECDRGRWQPPADLRTQLTRGDARGCRRASRLARWMPAMIRAPPTR